jgi:hypothetical protein
MMSSLHAAMRSVSARVERCGMRASLASGGVRAEDGAREVVREAVGRRKVVRVVGMDLER